MATRLSLVNNAQAIGQWDIKQNRARRREPTCWIYIALGASQFQGPLDVADTGLGFPRSEIAY